MPELSPVRGIITTPIFGASAPSGVGQISYGVTVGSTGATERWCYNPTPSSPRGGIYDVTTGGVWTRSSDLDFSGGTGDFANMPWFQVREGSDLIAGSTWWYSGPTAPVENTTAIPFSKRDNGLEWEPGTDLEAYNNSIRLIQREGVAGNWASPVIRTTGGGVIAGIVSGAESETTRAEGLGVEWVSTNALTVGEGAAFAPGAGVLDLSADLDLPGLSLTASSWHYLYLFNNDGVADVEVSLQRPASPYRGNARVKGGGVGGVLNNTDPDIEPDDTRRYIGAVYAIATNAMRRFQVLPGGFVRWVASQDGTLRAANVTANLNTIVETSVAAYCPPHGEAVEVVASARNDTNVATYYVASADDGLMGAAGGTGPSAGQLATNAIRPTAAQVQSVSGRVALGPTKALRHAQSLGAGGGVGYNVLEMHGFYEGI